VNGLIEVGLRYVDPDSADAFLADLDEVVGASAD
jgi:hypothetical protein